MISTLIYFIVIVILLSLGYWVVAQLLPEPMKKFANIVLVVIAVIAVIWLLLGLTGGGFSLHR